MAISMEEVARDMARHQYEAEKCSVLLNLYTRVQEFENAQKAKKATKPGPRAG